MDKWSSNEIRLGACPDGPWVQLRDYDDLARQLAEAKQSAIDIEVECREAWSQATAQRLRADSALARAEADAADARDAVRYRKLRALQSDRPVVRPRGRCPCPDDIAGCDSYHTQPINGELLDAAIDAIAQHQETPR